MYNNLHAIYSNAPRIPPRSILEAGRLGGLICFILEAWEMPPKCSQEAPKSPPRDPKSAPRGPKSAPRGPKSSP